MSQPYDHLLATLRAGTGCVFVDVQAPRDAPNKQCVASLWENADRRPSGTPVATVPVSHDQARELLAAGAEWKAPAHLRAEIVPGA